MNEDTPSQPKRQPQQKSAEPLPPPRPVTNRYELAPMPDGQGAMAVLEALLKQPGRIVWELTHGQAASVLTALLAITITALAIYGIVAGSLVGGSQLWIAPVKIVGGSLLSLFICLPSLYIFLCLSGGEARLRQGAGLAMASACLTALLLISFGPVAWIFAQSTDSLPLMGFLHLLFWVVALWFGLGFLNRGAALSNTAASGNLRVWMVIYVIVSLQMMTAVRPILGKSETFLPQTKQFFLAHWVQNLTQDAR